MKSVCYLGEKASHDCIGGTMTHDTHTAAHMNVKDRLVSVCAIGRCLILVRASLAFMFCMVSLLGQIGMRLWRRNSLHADVDFSVSQCTRAHMGYQPFIVHSLTHSVKSLTHAHTHPLDHSLSQVTHSGIHVCTHPRDR